MKVIETVDGFSILLLATLSFAEETAPLLAAPAAQAIVTQALKLPPYFTATSPNPKTSRWPHLIGGNTGVCMIAAGKLK
jgi:hypothetical protein